MEEKKEMNIIIKVFLWLVIIRHLVNIPKQAMLLGIYIRLEEGTTMLWGNIILSTIMILITYNILRFRTFALRAFYILQFINATWLGFRSDDFTAYYITAIVMCLLMFGLLHIKKNGIAARDLFDDIEEEDDDVEEKEKRTEYEEKKTEQLEEVVAKENLEEEIKKKTFAKFISKLPKVKNGDIDYEKLSARERYIYTKYSVSKEVALEDLRDDIEQVNMSILKLEEELKEAKGGKRLEIRDILAQKEKERQELLNIENDDVEL